VVFRISFITYMILWTSFEILQILFKINSFRTCNLVLHFHIIHIIRALRFDMSDNLVNKLITIFQNMVRDLVWFMVFNATFNNISAISWRSVLLVEEIGVPSTCRKSLTNLSHNVVSSTRSSNSQC
jgi:hypothetical protein